MGSALFSRASSFVSTLCLELTNCFPGLVSRPSPRQFSIAKPFPSRGIIELTESRLCSIVRDAARASDLAVSMEDRQTGDVRFVVDEEVGRIIITHRDKDFLISVESRD